MKKILKGQEGLKPIVEHPDNTYTSRPKDIYIKKQYSGKPLAYDRYKFNFEKYDPSIKYNLEDIDQFLYSDFIHRLKRENPKITDKEIEKIKDVIFNIPFETYYDPERYWEEINVDGYIQKKPYPALKVNAYYEPSSETAIKLYTELARRQLGRKNFNYKAAPRSDFFQFRTGYSNDEGKQIDDAYYNQHNDSRPYWDYKQRPTIERGGLNTIIRFKLWKDLKDELGRIPTLEETDEYIRNYNPYWLKVIFNNSNLPLYKNDRIYLKDEDVDAVKKALIHVAQNNNQSKQNDQLNYAKRGMKLIPRNR